MNRTATFTASLLVALLWGMEAVGQRVQFPTAAQPLPAAPPSTFAAPPPSTTPFAAPPVERPLYSSPPPAPPSYGMTPYPETTVSQTLPNIGPPPVFDSYTPPAPYYPPPIPPPASVPYATTSAPILSPPAFLSSWGGWYAGFEGTILEARTGAIGVLLFTDFPLGAVPVEVPVGELDFFPEFDLEFSPRVWAGYKGVAGFGGRARWWYFNHSSSGRFGLFPIPVGMEFGVDTDNDDVDDANVLIESTSLRTNLRVNSIDLEGTQDGQFHNWDFQVAGGVRYAKIDYDLIANIAGTIEMPIGEPPADYEEFEHTVSVFSEFEGVGPTIAMAARRPLLFTDGFAFLVNLRLAFLFGDSSASLAIDDTSAGMIGFEELVQVWEAQVGFEYSRQLQSGARLFGAAVLEAQVWEWNVPIGVAGGDLGFFGPTISVGLAR